jgi:DNA gyrase inhibitor GyrI
MSIRDSMAFEEFYKEWLANSAYEANEKDSLKSAYEAGFYRGIKAAKDYDPRWDAD